MPAPMPERPARDPFDVLAELRDRAAEATRRMADGTILNGRGALKAIEDLAADTIRHHQEDAASGPGLREVVRRNRTLSSQQDEIAEMLSALYGRSAVEFADAGRVVLRGLTGDVEREILTVDRAGVEDNGSDMVAVLRARLDHRSTVRGLFREADSGDRPEELDDTGCEECGGWPQLGGCDLCGAQMPPTGAVA
jgi:hypothetical protein